MTAKPTSRTPEQAMDKLKDTLDVKVQRTGQAAKNKFSPEFMNRLDNVAVFHPLRHEQLDRFWRSSWGGCSREYWTRGEGSSYSE